MELLKFPQDAAESHQKILDRVRAHIEKDVVAHLRALVVFNNDAWAPLCVRIDIARREEEIFPNNRPSGPIRLLTEVIELEDLIQRLTESFAGGALRVAGEVVSGHGMDAAWAGTHYTDNWRKFSTPWPVFHLYPNREVVPSLWIHEVIESENGDEAYDGWRDCIRSTMHFIDSRGDDMRFNRAQIVEWDYRGAIALKAENPRRTTLSILPLGDPNLKLSYVAYDGEKKFSKVIARPSELSIETILPIARINVALRHRGVLVCEDTRELYPQLTVGSPTPPEADSLLTTMFFGFMQNKEWASIVSSDLIDFEAAVRGGSEKGALVLGGAILENIVTDVLLRNKPIADSLTRKRKDVTQTGLAERVATAAKISVKLPSGMTMSLLRAQTIKMAEILIEHRDLIHAEAQIRTKARVDAHAVRYIHGLLGAVIKDFQDAFAAGALDAWSRGDTVP